MADLAPGAVLGDRFEIAGILGRGGMATVWLATDRVRGERVALKVLHDHLAGSSAMRARLRREVLASSRIRHPNALVASELYEIDGHLALSMPLHPGRTLQDHVQERGPLDPHAVERLARSISGALAEAHRQGVVHRDVTPTNVMVDDRNVFMLTDFGLARLDDQRTATATSALGTAGYAAPEVYGGTRADPRSDVYSLGAVLYYAATGKAPFDAPNPMGTLQKQLAEEYPSLAQARPDLPEPLVATIDAMLRREPGRRPQGASAVGDALDGVDVTRGTTSTSGTPAPTTAKTTLPAKGLPRGEFTVVVEERPEDHSRRHRLRRERRDLRRAQRRGRTRRQLERLLTDLATGVKQALGLDEDSPEQVLAAAVAAEAGFEGELPLTPALLDHRFRLVDATDEATARRLAGAALDAGFDAAVVPVRDLHGNAVPAWLFWVLLSVVAALVLAASVAFAVTQHGFPFFFFFGFFPFMFLNRRPRGEELPIAYGRQLLPVAGDREVAPPVAAPAKEPTLAERTVARIDALLAEVDAREDELSAVAASDLRATLRSLREQAVDLGEETARVEAELAGRDDAGEAAAAARVESRLERLRTLERAGDRVDRDEIAHLERSLAGHRQALAAVEESEARLTRLMGELLEIGGAASRASRIFGQERDAARSVDRLLGQLRGESEAADRTLKEMDALRRARAAAQRA